MQQLIGEATISCNAEDDMSRSTHMERDILSTQFIPKSDNLRL